VGGRGARTSGESGKRGKEGRVWARNADIYTKAEGFDPEAAGWLNVREHEAGDLLESGRVMCRRVLSFGEKRAAALSEG